MKAKKWIWATLTAMLCLCMGLFAVACGNKDDNGGGSSEFRFEDYSYNNGLEENDWRKLTYPETDIAVDGVVNAEEYGGQYVSISDVRGVNMKVSARMGQEGVFFGFVSDDTSIWYDYPKEVYNNTGVEIQVAPYGTAGLNANVIQLRLGANGYAEQWIGLKAHDGKYEYTRKYIPSMGGVRINGTLNSDDCNGYSAELYVPYSALNIEGKPDAVICAPSFNTKASAGAKRSTWTMMLGCSLQDPSTWNVVDETGITGKTSGFDDSNADLIKQELGGNKFYYIDTVPQKAFYMETEVSQESFLNNDNYPKFGLINRSEQALLTFHIAADGKNGTNFGSVRAQHTTSKGTEWLWDNAGASVGDGTFWGRAAISGYKNMKMGMLYKNGNLYMLLDGKLAYTVKDFATDTGVIPGFMCFNTKATFANTVYTTDEAEVNSRLAQYAAQELTIDGDLSDWEQLEEWDGINRSKLTMQDNGTKNAVTVYAFKGTDGLYVAYDATHRRVRNNNKFEGGWWNNTNIEFFVKDSTASKPQQFAFNAAADTGYTDSIMRTSERDAENDCYYTKGEIFVPWSSLNGYDKDSETLNVGFAFKTGGSDEEEKLNGATYWSFGGSSCPSKVTASGIFSSAPALGNANITLDGDISDWKGYHSVAVTGTGEYDGKSATFYSVLATDGLYLAVDVYHTLGFYDKDVWWKNTNFEFFVGMTQNGDRKGVQYYVSANGIDGNNNLKFENKSIAEMQVAYTSTQSAGKYHSLIEVFIPMEKIQSHVSNNTVRVGVAWKTEEGDNKDLINNSEAGDATAYWVPKGSYVDNDDKCYVTANGIYKPSEFAAL